MEKNDVAKACFQKRMGPAPFASFEDLSDEVRARLESPSDEKGSTSSIIRLPGIMEQDPTTPGDSKKSHLMGISLIGSASRKAYSTSTSQNTSSHSPILNKIKPTITPRIDISRASSSSHHDSRDSTPDQEICDSIEENNVKLGLGFKEDGALELRLSTEELDFHDATTENKKYRTGNQSPSPEPEDMYLTNRKDSQSSDVILLSISGRTSRLSSIGSQGSARSRHSNASHFSITSGQSAYSRCSSPHKTMLETSFCGPKVPESHVVVTQDESKGGPEEFEKILLSRRSTLTDSLLVEDITRPTSSSSKPIRNEQQGYKDDKVKNDDISKNPDEKPPRRSPLPKKIIASSGVEYIYIPLKGPLPTDDSEENCIKKSSSSTSDSTTKCAKKSSSQAQNHTKNTSYDRDVRPKSSPISTSHRASEHQPKYIRIKLKPDHCYDDDDATEPSHSNTKPTSLNLSLRAESHLSSNNIELDHQNISVVEKTRSLTNTPSVSPKFSRRFSKESSTPSPSVPRRNSLASMFKSGSESPSSSKSKRKNTLTSIIKTTSSCAGKGSDKSKTLLFPATSSTESVDSKGKSSSVLSIFKSGSTKDKHKNKDKPSAHEQTSTKSKESDNYRSQKKPGHSHETPLSSESIRIPLHSPTYYTKEICSPVGNEDLQVQPPVIEVSSQSEEYTVASLEPEKPNKELDNKVQDTNIIQSSSLNLELEDRELQSNISTKTELEKVPSATFKADFNKEICLEHKESPNVSKSMLSETPSTASRDSTKTSSSADLTTKIETHNKSNNGIDDEHNSSESERDLELEYLKSNNKPRMEFLEIERESIVLRTDSFEDELPYVPTTLPQERSAAVPILPIKQRGVLDVKTFPIERPRSTTPIYSSGLENYLDGFVTTSSHQSKVATVVSEKLKISLPRGDTSSSKSKGEVTITAPEVKEETPPPLPPKGIQKTWINFDEVPEKRKPPKRIQTIPSRGHIDISGLVLKDNIVYTYVNPDECKCECHEHKEPEPGAKTSQDGDCPLVGLENKATNSNR